MHQSARGLLLACVAVLSTACQPRSTSSTAMEAPEPGFTGHEGWAITQGGRGGRIIRVTTLDATGPGSISEAIAAEGPRIIVFEVGGVIDLDEQTLRVTEPFLTIAGQTAPSPGITFIRGGLQIQTHDVVVQHIRVRPGEAGHAKKSGWEVDGFSTLQGSRNVIVDHSSFTWGPDENLSVSGEFFDGETPEEWRENTSQSITYSSNIIAEGLSESTHHKGEHSKGTLLLDNSSRILILKNLYVSNMARNPQVKGGVYAAVVNNYIFNPGMSAVSYHLTDYWIRMGKTPVDGKLALVGNVMRHGQDTREGLPLLGFAGYGDLQLYAADNLAFDRSGAPAEIVRESHRDGGKVVEQPEGFYWPEGLEPMPAEQVPEHVLANAGARPWDRDPIDRRIVQGVRDGTARIIDSEQEVGGYPQAQETRRPFNPEEWNLDSMTPREGYPPPAR